MEEKKSGFLSQDINVHFYLNDEGMLKPSARGVCMFLILAPFWLPLLVMITDPLNVSGKKYAELVYIIYGPIVGFIIAIPAMIVRYVDEKKQKQNANDVTAIKTKTDQWVARALFVGMFTPLWLPFVYTISPLMWLYPTYSPEFSIVLSFIIFSCSAILYWYKVKRASPN